MPSACSEERQTRLFLSWTNYSEKRCAILSQNSSMGLVLACKTIMDNYEWSTKHGLLIKHAFSLIWSNSSLWVVHHGLCDLKSTAGGVTNILSLSWPLQFFFLPHRPATWWQESPFSDLILVFDLTVRRVFVSKRLSREVPHWHVHKLTSNFVFWNSCWEIQVTVAWHWS